jgi:hypothetical protein
LGLGATSALAHADAWPAPIDDLPDEEKVMPRYLVAMATLVVFIATSADARAQNRFALVIGNSSYESVSPLPNPVADANAVTELLTSAGFDVTPALNLNQTGMRRAVQEFAGKLADKGQDSVALVYYAGHGAQIDGQNYLIPVDADINNEAEIALESVRFADIMNVLDTVASRTRIVILDACRNNPFSATGKGAARGLAIVNAPPGSLVAYSTSPGEVAEDGTGTNSPFTQALIAAARKPGVPIENALKDVRLAVHGDTGGRQIPWEVSSLTTPFSFFPGATDAAPPPADENKDVVWRTELRSRSPQEAFDLVVREDRVVVYRVFLDVYAGSPLASRVRSIVDRRLEMMAWFDAVTHNSVAAYEAFLALYPNSDLSLTARRLAKRAQLRSAVASTSPGALGIAAGATAAPRIRTVIKEVPSPPQIKTVIKEVVKEVPVVKTVTKVVRVPSPPKTVVKTVRVPEVKTVTKVVRVPTPCRCSVSPRGPSFEGPVRRIRPFRQPFRQRTFRPGGFHR